MWDDLLDEVNTDREVGGIVYKLQHVYSADKAGKGQAQIESYYWRQSGKWARPMRVLVGRFKGQWGAFVSYITKGE